MRAQVGPASRVAPSQDVVDLSSARRAILLRHMSPGVGERPAANNAQRRARAGPRSLASGPCSLDATLTDNKCAAHRGAPGSIHGTSRSAKHALYYVSLMNSQVVAAFIAASVSVLTLIGTLAAQYFGRRATSRDTEKTLGEQGRHLDRTLAEQHEQLDRTLAEQRTRTLNERFATAADQLGSDKPAVRLAGVYAMAGLADDWEKNRQICVDVLCAYLRMPYEPDPGQDAPEPQRLAFQAIREVRHTVIRVITAHLKQNAAMSWQGLNLDFTGVVFDGGDFRRAQFSGGTALFPDAEFSSGRVLFSGAEFSSGLIVFSGARFSAAWLSSMTLSSPVPSPSSVSLSSLAAGSASAVPSSPAAQSTSAMPSSPAARSTSGIPTTGRFRPRSLGGIRRPQA